VKRRGRPRHPDVLTPAEWRVVDAVRHGMSNREIARRRSVSLDAVKFHVANARLKLGLPDRRALRAWRGIPAGSPAAFPRGVGGSVAELAGSVGDVEGTQGAGQVRLGAIGQVSRRVGDIDRAVRWYRDVLGLPHLYTYGDLAFFDCAGTRLFLSATGTGPGTGNCGAEQSIVYFRVDDVHRAQDELAARGVEFSGAPHMIFKHGDGTEEWMTFFTDPDGGPLALMAQVRTA
jgi:DNA-binding CsgD family transcriptional regulator/catechol 2,3-dioxygenase-like lactoylglutathione lyase family enzyme